MKAAISEFISHFRAGFARATGFAAALAVFSLGGLLVAQSLKVFSAGDLVSASDINANFQNIAARFGVLEGQLAPVGSIIAWHRDFGGGPGIPPGWVECDGLPIDDPDSPFDGDPTPNLNSPPQAWNSKGYFLRGGGTSGLFEDDSFQGHTHFDPGHSHTYKDQTDEHIGHADKNGGGPGIIRRHDSTRTSDPAGAGIAHPVAQANGAPRYGDETRPANMSVIWIMRIK